ncbi:TPM domain-containing protein [Mycobacterium sp. M23085]|uniref:TPM domain-containing protein n=1 Tax=Mycobacterium sp. M23085 TaxID=3378087 RepID=UPI00387796B2
MRCAARLIAVIATILTVGFSGGLVLAPTAGAQPPFRLADYITDNTGALSESGRSAVSAALDKLYTDRHIRLWVVYVDNFSGQNAAGWAQRTVTNSDLGAYDALLAVGTASREYAFLVPSTIKSVNATQVDKLRRNRIEPALHNGDWSGAAVAAANGLDASPGSSGRVALLAVLAGILCALAILMLVMRYRGRRRRAAALAAARRVDPTDADALAALSSQALDDLSRALVVDVDNALRTSANELELAVSEFGEDRTRPFTEAVTKAKGALAQAFTIRQQLDDDTPETPTQRRELLTRVIVSAARAERELESQTEAFEKLRDLVINAPTRLDSLTQQYVELTARIAPAEQRLAALHKDFSAAALTPVSGNVTAAKERLAFADRNIGTARELADHAVSGQQTGLVDAVRVAESALGQARALLDAVDNAAGDIQHAIDRLPSAMTDIEADIKRADVLLQKTPNAKTPHARDLVAARDAATRAVESARAGASDDPMGEFGQLTKADAALNARLATLAEEQAAAEQLNRSLEQALFTAQSRVRAVSDYVDTRRGSIGPEARTRLAEAKRHLQAAEDKRSTLPTEAIAHAHAASTLAATAQSLANDDVQMAQRAYMGRGGSDMGAMLGGIIIGNVLSGGMRGGFGGWSPTSFGGSPGSSGGGFMGGGGRF